MENKELKIHCLEIRKENFDEIPINNNIKKEVKDNE